MRNRNIVFVSSYPLNEPVIRNRLEPYLNGFIDAGFHAKLVNRSGGEFGDLKTSRFSHFVVKDKKIKRKVFFVRFIVEFIEGWKVIRLAKKKSEVGDFILVSVPSMLLMLFLYRLKGRKVLLDVRDLTWEYLSDKSILTRTFKLFFRKVALFVSSRVFLVIASNSSEVKYFQKLNSAEKNKVIYVPNGISLKQFEKLTLIDTNKQKNTRVKITYIGNVGIAQNLEIFVRAAHKLPQFDFEIVGAGTDYDRVMCLVKSLNANNISLSGRISWYEIPIKYEQADILYAQLTEGFSHAMPSKLYEYLASGKYVIYGGNGQAVSVLNEFDNITVVKPNSLEELVEALVSVTKENRQNNISFHNRSRIEEKYIRENNVKNLITNLVEI